MKRVIDSAEYVRYNANNAGNNVGDCVKRALSLAFDMSYNEIGKLLVAEMKRSHWSAWNMPIVYREVATSLGAPNRWTYVPAKEAITLSDFVDNECQKGTYLIETCSKPGRATNHIVCVVDGTVYDSWDSRTQYVDSYCKIPIANRKAFTDIGDHMKELRDEYEQLTSRVIEALVKKYQAKGAEWANNIDEMSPVSYLDGYKIETEWSVKLSKNISYADGSSKHYWLKCPLVLHPNDTLEEAHKIMQDTAKVRLYDRFYELNKKEQNRKEYYEAEQAQGGKVKLRMWGSLSNQFYKTMPAWAKAAAQDIWVHNPGAYSDSYDVTLVEPGTGKELRFYAPTADILRQELDLYKTEGLLINEDYSLTEMFDW